MNTPLSIARGAKRWKTYVEQSLTKHADLLAQLAGQVPEVDKPSGELPALKAEIAATREQVAAMLRREHTIQRFQAMAFEREAIDPLKRKIQELTVLSGEYGALFARRGSELLILITARDSALAPHVGGLDPFEGIGFVLDGTVDAVFVIVPDDTSSTSIHPADHLLGAIRKMPLEAFAWAEQRTLSKLAMPESNIENLSDRSAFFENLQIINENINAIDFISIKYSASEKGNGRGDGPFEYKELLPSTVPAQPKRRSVLFSQHCYYNFYYLARALRARGWDAHSISLEAPDSPQRGFYHGEDETIYNPDPVAHRRLIADFLSRNADRFGIVHTYGVGVLSLFPQNHDRGPHHLGIPWDIFEAKRRGVLIGYSHSGCLDGVSQSSFKNWSPSLCANCVWEDNPAVCSDRRNLAWGRKLTTIVDLFCTETDPPLDFKGASQAFRGPLTFAIDPDVWRSDLDVPDQYRRERRPGEILVYHAMGNYSQRSRDGRNVKGTGAVIVAVEQLRAEGIDIRLDFVHDVPSLDNRFVQVQADIIVDQLHYGRYGALAREGMLLGKPVVGRVDKSDGYGLPATRCIQETPIVHADESTVVDVLRDLALNPAKRAAIGETSRQHAIDWWSADRLAARFEQVYDHLRDHGRPPAEEDVI